MDLKASLPIEARPSPSLVRTLSKQFPDLAIPASCSLVNVCYMGDEGGIVCSLDIGSLDGRSAHDSITHLEFDRRSRLFRQIAAYQRHRIKKLRQLGRGPACGEGVGSDAQRPITSGMINVVRVSLTMVAVVPAS